MKKVKVTKRMLESYVKKLLIESEGVSPVIMKLSDVLPKSIDISRDKRKKNSVPGVEFVPRIDDNTYVMFSTSLYNEFLKSLNDGDEEQSTGYGHKFENIAKTFLNTAANSNMIGLNLNDNMPFADLLDTNTNTLFTVKMSTVIGMSKLTGVGYRTIPQALSIAAQAGNGLDFNLGYIKGKLDYSYIQSLGYIGLPVEIKIANPVPGTRKFSLSTDSNGKQIYGIKGTFDQNSPPEGLLALVDKLNKRNNSFTYKADSTGVMGYWSDNMSGPEPLTGKTEQITSLANFERQFMANLKDVTAYKVLLVGAQIYPKSFESLMRNLFNRPSGKVSSTYQKYIEANMDYLDVAIRNTVTGQSPGKEADKAPGASREMISYLLTEQEIISKPYTGNVGFNMYAVLQSRGSNTNLQIIKVATGGTTISSISDILASGTAIAKNSRVASDKRYRLETQLHYIDVVKEKADAMLSDIEHTIVLNDIQKDKLSKIQDLRTLKMTTAQSGGSIRAISMLAKRIEAAINQAKKANVPDILLEKRMSNLGIKTIFKSGLSGSVVDEPLIVYMNFYDKLINLYLIIKSAAQAGKFDELMGEILPTLFPNESIDYDISANQPFPEEELEMVAESRLYEAILTDLMTASAKKQRAASQPKKLKMTKRQLQELMRRQLK